MKGDVVYCPSCGRALGLPSRALGGGRRVDYHCSCGARFSLRLGDGGRLRIKRLLGPEAVIRDFPDALSREFPDVLEI